MFGCGVFIDLQKALDIVDHFILLNRLDYYGCRVLELNWFSFYLLNHIQFFSQ